MLIDWFTVAAQVINFLVLVWLLKRFLYKPIIDAIDAREKRIAAELADADAKKAEAQHERDEFQHKNEAFEQQRAALLSQAIDEVKAKRQELLDEARQSADALLARRMETLTSDARNLNQAISRRAQQEVFAIARKTLADLATTTLEQRMVDVYIGRLRELDDGAREGFVRALNSASEPALLRSAFDLPAEQREALQTALNEVFAADIPLKFQTAPELVSGIEFSTGGQKLAWSISDYLASLAKGVDELLQAQARPAARPGSGAEVAGAAAKSQ